MPSIDTTLAVDVWLAAIKQGGKHKPQVRSRVTKYCHGGIIECLFTGTCQTPMAVVEELERWSRKRRQLGKYQRNKLLKLIALLKPTALPHNDFALTDYELQSQLLSHIYSPLYPPNQEAPPYYHKLVVKYRKKHAVLRRKYPCAYDYQPITPEKQAVLDQAAQTKTEYQTLLRQTNPDPLKLQAFRSLHKQAAAIQRLATLRMWPSVATILAALKHQLQSYSYNNELACICDWLRDRREIDCSVFTPSTPSYENSNRLWVKIRKGKLPPNITVQDLLASKNRHDHNGLHIAAQYGHYPKGTTVQDLIQCTSKHGVNALCIAAQNGHLLPGTTIADLTTTKDAYDNSALHLAAQYKQLPPNISADDLLQPKDSTGLTPLHLSIYQLPQDTTPELLANCKDNEGNTPLHGIAKFASIPDYVTADHLKQCVNLKNESAWDIFLHRCHCRPETIMGNTHPGLFKNETKLAIQISQRITRHHPEITNKTAIWLANIFAQCPQQPHETKQA